MVSREVSSYFDGELFQLFGSARRTSIETQQVDANEKAVLVICHTRELAYRIKHEFDRFSKYLVKVKLASCIEVCPSRRIAKCSRRVTSMS